MHKENRTAASQSLLSMRWFPDSCIITQSGKECLKGISSLNVLEDCKNCLEPLFNSASPSVQNESVSNDCKKVLNFFMCPNHAQYWQKKNVWQM